MKKTLTQQSECVGRTQSSDCIGEDIILSNGEDADQWSIINEEKHRAMKRLTAYLIKETLVCIGFYWWAKW